jgi:hypothetical protein
MRSRAQAVPCHPCSPASILVSLRLRRSGCSCDWSVSRQESRAGKAQLGHSTRANGVGDAFVRFPRDVPIKDIGPTPPAWPPIRGCASALAGRVLPGGVSLPYRTIGLLKKKNCRNFGNFRNLADTDSAVGAAFCYATSRASGQTAVSTANSRKTW